MKKNFRQKNKGPAPYEAGGFRSGFTLVETLVALSIFTVSILGLLGVLTRSSANINYAKQKMTASYLAQEGMECIRNIRDNYVLYPDPPSQSWNGFRTMNPDDFSNIACPATPEGFTRTLSKNIIGPDEVKVFSKVEWTQASGTPNITFSGNLFNWVE